VEHFINSVSGMVNSLLATSGFTVPVTQADVALALAQFVEDEVAAMVEGVNGSGRFGPNPKFGGTKSRYALVTEDVQKFITSNAAGFEMLGAVRPGKLGAGIAFKGQDDAGNSVQPLFDRASFSGQDTFLREWWGGDSYGRR
jgi:hypothetical protein